MAALRIAYVASLVLFALSVALNIVAWSQLESTMFFAIACFIFLIALLALIVQTFPLLVEAFSDEEFRAFLPALSRRISLSALDRIGAIRAAARRDAPLWSKALGYALVFYMSVICLTAFIGSRPIGAMFLSAMLAWICWSYVMALAFSLSRLSGTGDPQAGVAGRL
jgi:hypothetical protein